ncbi:MAG: hypothetical protein E6J42_02390 [Chloroflexi bacterium]|nr:MAG: hypothetical protein E6J42_02390 [Chloroflexota bacterium]
MERLLGDLTPPRRGWWTATLITAGLLSTFELTHGGDGSFTYSFRLTPITALLIALLWLPTLIRVGALGGGSVKTPAGEATLAGIPLELLRELDVDTQREALPALIAVADAAEAKADSAAAPALRQVREDLQDQLAALTPDAKAARRQLAEYAHQYDEIRKTKPAGSVRTWEMTLLIGAARALGPQARYTPDELARIFASGSEGERIVGLATIQANHDPATFHLALEALDHSRSAFEQYHALEAIDEMLESLIPAQRRDLEATLIRQRSGAPKTWINRDDRSRWDLSTTIMRRLTELSAK